MRLEHVFWCDRSDCHSHVRTAASAPSTGVLVHELPPTGNQDGDVRWFCSWDCLMLFAAAVSVPSAI